MRQKISIGLSVVICTMILALILFVGNQESDVKIKIDEPAQNYEQLELYLQNSSNIVKVNIWKAEADCYYFFLPSYAVNSHVFFGNLQDGDRIIVGQNSYDSRDNILSSIEYDVVYDMQMIVKEEELTKQKVMFLHSENLPAIFLDTQTGNMDRIHSDKNIKEAAEATIIDVNGRQEFSGAIEYIKARGNSTFYEVDKKSYQMKLHSKKNLFELGKAKKWILLANAKDESLVRTSLIFDYASKNTEVASIEGTFVDVYLNGDYAGNYYLCEKVEVGKNRLNITNLEEKNETENSKEELENAVQYVSEDGVVRALLGVKNPEDITGGYLLEKIIAEEYELARCAFVSSMGYSYRVVSPENASIEQVEYIRDFVNALELAISQPDGIHPETGKHYTEYMNVESWVSKFLIEEVFNNPDAPAASTYMYKDSDAVDGKMYFGPVWDYDRAIGGYVVESFSLDDPRQIGYRGVYASRLFAFPEIENAVKQEYEEQFLPYLKREAEEQIEILQEYVEASAQMDKVRWPQAKGYYGTWQAAGEYMINFLEERASYLSDVWLKEQQYHTVLFLDYYGNTYKKYMVKHGEYLNEIPSIATYVAVFNGWQNVVTGRKLDARLPILEDVAYQSTWINAEYLILNGLDIADAELSHIDVEALEALLESVKQMREAAKSEVSESEESKVGIKDE